MTTNSPSFMPTTIAPDSTDSTSFSQVEDKSIILAHNISKMYPLYDDPSDRLKQSLWYALPKFLRGQSRTFYREFWALHDVSFEIKQGETVGIIGRNGSGKSTLLQIIAGTLTPSQGEVKVKGRVAALLELGSGFNPEFSGRENVFLNGAIMGISQAEMAQRFDKITAFADIGDFIDQPIKLYSSGMLARLAFATAISVDADILIADEILAVGDMAFQAKCFREFHRLRENGCTILFVSHDVYAIRSFCQKSLYLKEGLQMAWGDSYGVIDKYLTDVEESQVSDKVQQLGATQQSEETTLLFSIDEVLMVDQSNQPLDEISSGDAVSIKFKYRSLTSAIDKVVFVINLYKSDGLYICGTTTMLDSFPPIDPGQSGWVTIHFSDFNLLAGNYYWRVAIDDEQGFGVYAAANYVCPFKVHDRLEAIGLINLSRSWHFQIT